MCHICEERPEDRPGSELCAKCGEGLAEAANERLHEGEPPVSATERARLAWERRRDG